MVWVQPEIHHRETTPNFPNGEDCVACRCAEAPYIAHAPQALRDGDLSPNMLWNQNRMLEKRLLKIADQTYLTSKFQFGDWNLIYQMH